MLFFILIISALIYNYYLSLTMYEDDVLLIIWTIVFDYLRLKNDEIKKLHIREESFKIIILESGGTIFRESVAAFVDLKLLKNQRAEIYKN